MRAYTWGHSLSPLMMQVASMLLGLVRWLDLMLLLGVSASLISSQIWRIFTTRSLIWYLGSTRARLSHLWAMKTLWQSRHSRHSLMCSYLFQKDAYIHSINWGSPATLCSMLECCSLPRVHMILHCLNVATGIVNTLHYPQIVAPRLVVSSPDRILCTCPAALLMVWTLSQEKLELVDVIVGVVMYFPEQSDWYYNMPLQFVLRLQFSQCSCPDSVFAGHTQKPQSGDKATKLVSK